MVYVFFQKKGGLLLKDHFYLKSEIIALEPNMFSLLLDNPNTKYFGDNSDEDREMNERLKELLNKGVFISSYAKGNTEDPSTRQGDVVVTVTRKYKDEELSKDDFVYRLYTIEDGDRVI